MGTSTTTMLYFDHQVGSFEPFLLDLKFLVEYKNYSLVGR
jgi:hypothetical protein